MLYAWEMVNIYVFSKNFSNPVTPFSHHFIQWNRLTGTETSTRMIVSCLTWASCKGESSWNRPPPLYVVASTAVYAKPSFWTWKGAPSEDGTIDIHSKREKQLYLGCFNCMWIGYYYALLFRLQIAKAIWLGYWCIVAVWVTGHQNVHYLSWTGSFRPLNTNSPLQCGRGLQRLPEHASPLSLGHLHLLPFLPFPYIAPFASA